MSLLASMFFFHAGRKKRIQSSLEGKVSAIRVNTPWPFSDLAVVAKALERSSLLLRQQKYQEAEILLQEAVAYTPHDQQILVSLAHVASGLKDWPEAERRWSMVISIYPEIHFAHGYHATAVALQGRSAEARSLYLELLSRFPADLGPPSHLAYMLDAMELPDRDVYITAVDEALSRLRVADPHSVVALKAHACVARVQGDWRTAYHRLKLASQLALNDEQIKWELEEALSRCSQTE